MVLVSLLCPPDRTEMVRRVVEAMGCKVVEDPPKGPESHPFSPSCRCVACDAERRVILEKPWDELNLSVRAYNCLLHQTIYDNGKRVPLPRPLVTVGDLCAWPPKDLLRLKNLGPGSVADIERALEDWGLKLPT